MITKKAQTAISILHAISSNASAAKRKTEQEQELFDRLESAKIIRLKEGVPKYQINSYELLRPRNEISLLDILEATGEHLNCNHPTMEEFYSRYGKAGQRLGVVNHMTRLYLQDIKLTEL